MRRLNQGWRSARARALVAPPTAAAVGATASPVPPPWLTFVPQPLRLGIGLIALVFYLWIVHSYKLPAGDVAIAALAIGVLVRGGEIRVPTPLVVFGFLILWGCLSLAVSEDIQRSLDALLSLGKLWVIAFCVINVIKTSAELRFLIIAWLAVYALYPVRGALYNQYICHCAIGGRVSWNFIFANPNDLAAFTMIPLGLCAGLATVERVKFFRMSALVGVVILSMIILLTQSRGAVLGLGAALLLLLFQSRHKGRDILLGGLLLGGAIVFAPKSVWDRVAGLSNVSVQGDMAGVDPERSAESRWQIWQIAMSKIRQSPVTGVGIAMMPVEHSKEASRQNLPVQVRGEKDTHSTYLRLAAEMGVPALILYLVMWGTIFRRVRQARRSIAGVRPKDHQVLFFLEMALCAFLVASVFGTYFSLAFTYLIMSVAWLSAEILSREPWYVSPKAMQQLQARPAR